MVCLTLFTTFFKIGLFTIGGGYAMIPLIQTEVIDRHGWMTLDQFTEFVGIAESTPGPFAINISTFCGMTTGGILGSVSATVGVVLPSMMIILLIAAVAGKVLSHWSVQAALRGAKPVVIGLIGAAAVSLLLHTFQPSLSWQMAGQAGMALLLFVLAMRCRFSALMLILCGACAGVFLQLCGISL